MFSSWGSVYGYWQLALLLLITLGFFFMLRSLQLEFRRIQTISKFLTHKSNIETLASIDTSSMNIKVAEYILANFSKLERDILISEGFVQMTHHSI